MKLETEILEHLLIDREVGRLSGDVKALLDAYLSADPHAQSQSAQIAETVALARQALCQFRQPEPAPLPPLRRPTDLPLSGRRNARRLAATAFSMAACLVIGIGIGLWVLGPVKEKSQAVSMTRLAPPPEETPQGEVGAEGLWSMRRLYQQAKQAQPRPAPVLVWKSPTRVSLAEKGSIQ
jgi:hypothetical protein